MISPPPVRGRGSATNPKNRFESIERVAEPPEDSDEISSPDTQFFPDHSKSIIAYNDSPDIGFDASINPYRGCEHGCVYCLSGDTPILMADGTTKSSIPSGPMLRSLAPYERAGIGPT